MERKINITFGPPGTGKTTAMLKRVEQFLEQGIPPERIAFVSYTRKAVQEAAGRAAEKFGLDPKQLVNFKTLHSTAYHSLGIRRNQMMGKEDYKELSALTGVKCGGYSEMSDGLGLTNDKDGDAMLGLISYANATSSDLRDVWAMVEHEVEWFKLKQFNDALHQYKNDMNKMDFDDLFKDFMLQRPCINADAVIIDEAQDLSNAQWDMAKVAFRHASSIDIAADDDQCIHSWAGANVNRFLAIKGDTSILNQSYRLPRAVYNVADKIIKNVGNRRAKDWAPRDEEGSVNYINDIAHANLKDPGTWLLLARNSYLLADYKEACHVAGIPYIYRGKSSLNADDVLAIRLWVKRQRLQKGYDLSDEDYDHLFKYTKCEDLSVEWFDALDQIDVPTREYYLSVLRNGYKLTDDPKTVISTIHGVKGGEADNVVLRTDMSYRSYESMSLNADNEHRVFYVGATRARNNLFIVQPQTTRGYLI